MPGLLRKSFDKPDEVRPFDGATGQLEVVNTDEGAVGRAIFLPGWELVGAYQANRKKGQLPSRAHRLLRLRLHEGGHGRWRGDGVRARRLRRHGARTRRLDRRGPAVRRHRLAGIHRLRQALSGVGSADSGLRPPRRDGGPLQRQCATGKRSGRHESAHQRAWPCQAIGALIAQATSGDDVAISPGLGTAQGARFGHATSI